MCKKAGNQDNTEFGVLVYHPTTTISNVGFFFTQSDTFPPILKFLEYIWSSYDRVLFIILNLYFPTLIFIFIIIITILGLLCYDS